MSREIRDLPTGSTSRSLIRRAQLSDAAAWRHLCHIYGPLVYRWARQSGLQDSDAADVGQEVLRTIAGRLAVFDHGQPNATFRGWLWTVTQFKLREHARRRAKNPNPPGGSEALRQIQCLPDAPLEETTFPPGDSHDGFALRVAEVVRHEFPPATWQAFWLTAVEGRPIEAVAEELGLTRRAVIQRVYRVRCRLREELGDG